MSASRSGRPSPRATADSQATASRVLLRYAIAVALAFATMLMCSSGAVAAGPAVNIATPFDIQPPGPSVAVDSGGNAIVAWANDKDLAGAPDLVQYCVLPVGGTTCAYSGSIPAADSAGHVDAVRVLDDGGTLVLLADVYGAAGKNATDYEPEQEWQSTDDGASWTQQATGLSVSSGIIDADTVPVDAVILPGTGGLGYGWVTAEGPPTFNAFPLAGAPECSLATCPAGFATLEPDTNPDQLGNEPGHFASIPSGPLAGVMGAFDTVETAGPLGCSQSFGDAYVYGSGAQSASNNYNISPGQPNSAWRVPVTQADCDLEYTAVGGGPSGFGILADDLGNDTVVYHRFDAATTKFDTPLATVANEGGQSPAISQDGSGGVYATFLGQGGVGGPIRLAYSADGGNAWTVNTLDPNSDLGADDVTSNVNATGQGWAAWIDNGSVYAQSFQAADAFPPVVPAPAPKPTAISTSQTAGATVGASIVVSAGTVGETDQATISGANAASAGGTVNYRLYSNPTCASSSKVFESTAAVTAGKAAASAPVTAALAAGSYYWQVTYSGDANNQPGSSTCGSEVLTVIGPATVSESATSTEKSVTVSVNCASFPCTITITLTAPETVLVKAARVARKKKKPKKITLATGTFTLHRAGKVTLHLSKAGRKLLSAHHGRLSASLLLSEKIDGHTVTSTRTIEIAPARKKHKK
jgi:hypothetical protein